MSLAKAERNQWKASEGSKEYVQFLHEQLGIIKDMWAGGQFVTELTNAEALGRIAALEIMIDYFEVEEVE